MYNVGMSRMILTIAAIIIRGARRSGRTKDTPYRVGPGVGLAVVGLGVGLGAVSPQMNDSLLTL